MLKLNVLTKSGSNLKTALSKEIQRDDLSEITLELCLEQLLGKDSVKEYVNHFSKDNIYVVITKATTEIEDDENSEDKFVEYTSKMDMSEVT